MYEGGSKLNYKGKKYVTVEQHIKCKCDCKVKEEVSTDCKTVFSDCPYAENCRAWQHTVTLQC